MIATPRIQHRQVPTDYLQWHWPDAVHPVLKRIYAARGIRDGSEVNHRLKHLLRPDQLSGMDKAITRLIEALDQQQHVLVAGDYDCDGATGCAVAVRGLRLLGFQHVDFVVPHRLHHGYGLSPALVASLDKKPDVILTVDNGVASVAGVEAAKKAGIDVIVTDHHLPGEKLPEAVAIVNPNLSDDPFPSKALAGVGVMFYVLLALRAKLREQGRFTHDQQPDLSLLLDMVALGTVADLVPLDTNNRILVQAGLRRIRAGKACAGLQALMDACNRSSATLTSTDMAFALAPRLNAAGRLEDMTIGIACLLSQDAGQAMPLANQLCAINAQRKQLQQEMMEEAEYLAARIKPGNAMGMALYEPHWHAGIIGLVASKIKDRLYRPVIAFAPASNDAPDLLRGSARSIPGFHIRDALAELATGYPDLMNQFGGHAMAAGLSLPRAHFKVFARHFNDIVIKYLGDTSNTPVIWSEGPLEPHEMTFELASQIRQSGPWGQAFEAPLFDNDFELVHIKVIAQKHRRLTLREPESGQSFEAIMFNVPEEQSFPEHLHAVYELSINEWKGQSTLQLIVHHVQ